LPEVQARVFAGCFGRLQLKVKGTHVITSKKCAVSTLVRGMIDFVFS
jgi:hypothetical protein